LGGGAELPEDAPPEADPLDAARAFVSQKITIQVMAKAILWIVFMIKMFSERRHPIEIDSPFYLKMIILAIGVFTSTA
jgi:hypothetical protein